MATRCSTRAPRIGPSGAAAPSASRSAFRSGRSQTKSLSFTRHWRCSRERRSVASGIASASRCYVFPAGHSAEGYAAAAIGWLSATSAILPAAPSSAPAESSAAAALATSRPLRPLPFRIETHAFSSAPRSSSRSS